MSTFSLKRKLLLLLIVPFFMFNVCGRHDVVELPDHPNTDEYFTWRIPGYNGNITSPPDSVVYSRTNNTNVFAAYSSSGFVKTNISFDGPQGTGNYTSNDILIYTNGKYYVTSTTPIQISVLNFGSPGQPITGSYSGTVRDSANTSTYTVTGNFKLKNQ